MKPITIISCILCILLLGSCATSKNTEHQQQIDYSSELQQLRNSLDSLHMDIDKQSKVTADKLSNLKLENKTVYLSMPDSTGKQYPIKQSITNINKQDTEHTESAETLSISISQISSKLDSLYQRVNELSKSSGKTIELSWWDLHIKDRLLIPSIFPERGNFMDFNLKKSIARKIAISEQDRKDYEIVEKKEEKRIEWNVQKDAETPLVVEFSKEELDYMRRSCEAIAEQQMPDEMWAVVERIYNEAQN